LWVHQRGRDEMRQNVFPGLLGKIRLVLPPDYQRADNKEDSKLWARRAFAQADVKTGPLTSVSQIGVRKRADKPRTEPRGSQGTLLLLRGVNWATERQKNGKKS
jgi:hypothetical protein